MTPVYNVGEKPGIRLHKVIPRMSFLLIQQFLWRMKEKYIIRDFHPLVFFYMFAVLLLGSCVLLAVRLVCWWYSIGRMPEMNAMACMFTAISGIQFLLFGMWFDMEYNKHLKHPGSRARANEPQWPRKQSLDMNAPTVPDGRERHRMT